MGRGAVAAARGLAVVFIAGAVAWATLALWLDGPTSRPLAAALAGASVSASLAIGVAVRPFRRAALCVLGLFSVVLLWWITIEPSNDRDWMADVARTPTAEIVGDRLTIENLRNFEHRSQTDFTERWETRTFDLSGIRGLDIFISFWGPTLIGHTIMSWEFADGRHLPISIETRKERGESYSALRGFFRQFELYYVVSDERDVIRLRTDYRGEDVYLYRLATPAAQARALLISYLDRINALAHDPRWYNALTHNCTTSIRLHVQQTGTRNPWNWRILVNGRADELLYMRGLVNTSLPLSELKQRSRISERAMAAGDSPDFSSRIREGLPPRPEPVS